MSSCPPHYPPSGGRALRRYLRTYVIVLVLIFVYTTILAVSGLNPETIVWLVSTVSATALTAAAALQRVPRSA